MKTKLVVCSCNGTIAVDSAALGRALGSAGVAAEEAVSGHELCRRQLPRAADAFEGTDDVVVTCTQESALFDEVARARQTLAPIRFVNIREQAGWGAEGNRAQPKIAALVAMAAAPAMDPVPSVSYRSDGRVLIVGDAQALRWADRLAERLSVTVLLVASHGASLAAERRYPVASGAVLGIEGWLGAFTARWEQTNPIDLDACVRCGACVAACPEGAIGADLQVDPDRCRAHRRCVDACADIGAIDFTRADRQRGESFDLVLDLRPESAFERHQLPQGYFHPGLDLEARVDAALAIEQMVGEFEKPKFFRYREKLCAHSRNRIEGCSRCIDVCSADAVRSVGDRIEVEPHLCVGCGACTTVCPSGALGYAYPTPENLGRRMRSGLTAYRAAGGRDALLLVHDSESGRALMGSLGRRAGAAVRRAPQVVGLPARAIPLEVHHIASVGIDLALSALAFGASQVAWVATGSEAPQYLDALREQMEIAQTIVSGLGYTGRHFHLLEAADATTLEAALPAIAPAQTVATAAVFALAEEKRRSIEFAIDHLVAQARAAGRAAPQQIGLPQGSPFGTIRVDTAACTLCLACTGACPEAALLDNPDSPQLRFIERNCVQCGICAATCPEKAIALQPRLLLETTEARNPRVLNEAQPFECISCGKAFGTKQMIDNMLGRLSGHAMFGGAAARRLQMCGDCRVVDMFSRTDEESVFDVTRGGRG